MWMCTYSRAFTTAAIVVFIAFTFSGPKALAGNLFVIIATDDGAPKIGADMAKNSTMMISMIKRNVPRNRSQIVKMPASSLTAAAVQRSIALLPTAADDTVLFYYSGHGAYDTTRQQTYLMMSNDRGQAVLYVGQIRRSIEARGVRFVAIVVDCCNNLRPVRGLGPIVPWEPGDDRPPEISPVFQHLFFEPAGSVIIESSAPGEYAIIEPAIQFRDPRRGIYEVHSGSLFTQCFSQVVESPLQEDEGEHLPEWSQVCRKTQERIDMRFPELCPRGVIPLGNGQLFAQKCQTVTAWINNQLIPTR